MIKCYCSHLAGAHSNGFCPFDDCLRQWGKSIFPDLCFLTLSAASAQSCVNSNIMVTVHRQTAHSATLYAISLSAEALSEICVRSYATITLTEHWVLPIAVGNFKWQNPLLEHAESV